MISFELWVAFIIATTIMLIIPGPTILFVLGSSLTHGKKVAFPLAFGVTLGDLTALLLSMMGVSTILLISSTLFYLFKWAGALYLFYLGISLWRSEPENNLLVKNFTSESRKQNRSFFTRAWIITSLNPKGILFFSAFLPQFVDHSKTIVPQLIILGGTFLVCAFINALLYALFAVKIRNSIQRPQTLKNFNRGGGVALMSAGVITAVIE